MKYTYVFDFYNLYIPKGHKYMNSELGITITPLKFAEEFEKTRASLSKPCRRGGWKTAKCYISTKTEEEAKKIASWLELLYSFAQGRSVFFLGFYKKHKGKKYSSFQSKFIEPRENRFSELIHGVKTKGAFYTRDISLFLDTALSVLVKLKADKLNNILSSMHAHLISKSEIVQELKFLISWVALEKLANEHYSVHKSKNKLFEKEEITKIKKTISDALNAQLKSDGRLPLLKKSITRNFLYEHNTYEKTLIYLTSLDLGFEKSKLKCMLKKLIEVRGKLVHSLNSAKLLKEPQLLFYLQKIMEIVILRLLGIDQSIQKKFILHQYNRGTDL